MIFVPDYSLYHITPCNEAEDILQDGIQLSDEGAGGPGVYLWVVKNTQKAHKAFLYQLYDFIYEYKLGASELQYDQSYIDNHLNELFTLFIVKPDKPIQLYDYDMELFSQSKDVDEAVSRFPIPCPYLAVANDWERVLIGLDSNSDEPFNFTMRYYGDRTNHFN